MATSERAPEASNGRAVAFRGSVWVADDPTSRIPASVELRPDSLSIRSQGAEIGTWPRDQLALTEDGPRFHLEVEGERLVIDLTDRDRFAEVAGLVSNRAAPQAQNRAEPDPIAALRPKPRGRRPGLLGRSPDASRPPRHRRGRHLR